MIGFDDPAVFAFVDVDVMLQYPEGGRDYLQFPVHFVRKPAVSIRKQFCKFLFFDRMRDLFYRKSGQILISFAGFFLPPVADHFFHVRLIRDWTFHQCLGFIEPHIVDGELLIVGKPCLCGRGELPGIGQ